MINMKKKVVSKTILALLIGGILTFAFKIDVGIAQGTIEFVDSYQSLGNSNSRDVALEDLNNDGDLDAFIANGGPNKVWYNYNSAGDFADTGQSLGNSDSWGVALGDLNGDDDLDAFIANYGPNKVWYDYSGGGDYADTGQSLGNSFSFDVALGDLDGDDDLDAFVANHGANRVWLNYNGAGDFAITGQSLGTANSEGVALGDLDGDDDLDAFVANFLGEANRVWLNNGDGTFSAGQSLGSSDSLGVALGDLDGDDDLDAFVANNYANRVWLNNGDGTFSAGQSLGTASSFRVALGDLDGDDDLDAFVANVGPNKVWLNERDLYPPNIVVLSPENKTYSVDSVPLNFTVDETTSWMGYSLDGQANVTTAVNTTLSSLLDGGHHVVVYANDTAGNMGASETVYFTVDTTSPNISAVHKRQRNVDNCGHDKYRREHLERRDTQFSLLHQRDIRRRGERQCQQHNHNRRDGIRISISSDSRVSSIPQSATVHGCNTVGGDNYSKKTQGQPQNSSLISPSFFYSLKQIIKEPVERMHALY
jgi:hypothetical protein